MKKVFVLGIALLSVSYSQNTPAQSTEITNAFQKLDTNHDGFVSIEELKIKVRLKREDSVQAEVVKSTGEKEKEEEIEDKKIGNKIESSVATLISRFDLDKNGLDLKQFLEMIAQELIPTK